MRYVIILPLIGLIALCCNKPAADIPAYHQNKAVIRGINPCMHVCIAGCPCDCGNYFFHFTDSTDTANVVVDDPEIFHFPADIQYPVHLLVSWKKVTRCNTTAIWVTAYKIE